MAGPKQSKRVSWSPGVNLCQVRLFLSEEAPSQSGLGSQDHLQAKAAWLLHSSSAASDDSVPPGFEAIHSGQIQRNIPLIKWQCPPILWLKPEWLVVTGEESKEVAMQIRRQLGVLEAVYPRLSSIPPDPSVSPDVLQLDDSQTETPLIPIISIEEEDTAVAVAVEADTAAARTISSSYFIPPPITSAPGSIMPPIQTQKPLTSTAGLVGPGTSAEPDIAAAASAAFTAIMRSNEEGSLVDRDLLIKILRDPSMVGKLVSEYSSPKQTPLQIASSAYPLVATKDVSYYKSLIQKHGGNRQEPVPLPYEYHNNPLYMDGVGNEMRQSESRKQKIEKPCAYFNTFKGCRQGDSCSYLHISSTSKKIERKRGGPKRVRFDR